MLHRVTNLCSSAVFKVPSVPSKELLHHIVHIIIIRDDAGIASYRSGRKRHGWPGGRHASPTELKMRSGITTFSVKFATFPANQSFRTTAESMRPRAKSFIRSISQIKANRQKFSLSMTSEVRKCPKSAKSGRKTGFLLGAVKRGGEGVCNV